MRSKMIYRSFISIHHHIYIYINIFIHVQIYHLFQWYELVFFHRRRVKCAQRTNHLCHVHPSNIRPKLGLWNPHFLHHIRSYIHDLRLVLIMKKQPCSFNWYLIWENKCTSVHPDFFGGDGYSQKCCFAKTGYFFRALSKSTQRGATWRDSATGYEYHASGGCSAENSCQVVGAFLIIWANFYRS